jgi:hypothetical protein
MRFFAIAGVISLCASSIAIAANWTGILRYVFARRNYSMIPIVGGVAGSVGLLLLGRWRAFLWVPLVADPGCAWLGVMLIVRRLKHSSQP